MTKENRLANILAALQAAEKDNAQNGYNYNIASIINALQPVADDLKSEIAHAAVKSVKPGLNATLSLIEKIIKSVPDYQRTMRGKISKDGFDYFCDGFILVKTPADKFNTIRNSEPNAPDLSRIINQSYIADKHRDELPAAAALKSAVKIAKSNYGAKQIKARGGLIYRFNDGLTFNAEKLTDILTALEGINPAFEMFTTVDSPLTARMFAADDINILLMPVRCQHAMNGAGLYMGDTKIDL